MNTIIDNFAHATAAHTVNITLQGADFAVDVAMLRLDNMRQTAGSNYQQYEVRGRNATIALMSSAYALWHAAKQASQADFDKFKANIKQKLTDLGIEFKSSSTTSGLLVRYIFDGSASDKQVHVYGRSLDVAYERGIAADGFEALVRNTENGFEGLRAAALATVNTTDKGAVALSACVNAPTLQTIDGLQWETDRGGSGCLNTELASISGALRV